MPKITRKHQKIFALNSSDTGQFGSARAGTFVTDTDPDVIQSLAAWEQGWNEAVISGDKLFPLEEVQGVDYVTTRQIAYVFQEGIPEYDSDTVYYQNSLVKEAGTVNLYKSLTNDNQGNALSSALNWKFLVNLDNVIGIVNNYTATTDPTVNDDESEGYSVGSIWYNTATPESFLCTDATDGAAVWINISLGVDDLGTMAFEDAADYYTETEVDSIISGLSLGKVIKTASFSTGAVATGTTQIPYDNSIPQNTEGNEYMTLAFTPLRADSTLLIESTAIAAGTAATQEVITMALFIDSTANALAASTQCYPAPNYAMTLSINHTMASPGTSEVTFKIRLGLRTSGTLTFNGVNGTRLFGGVSNSTIKITEYAP